MRRDSPCYFEPSQRNRDDEVLFLDPTLIFPVLSFCSSKMWGMPSWKIDLWSQKYYFQQPKKDQFKDIVIVTNRTFINYSFSAFQPPLPPSPPHSLLSFTLTWANCNFCSHWWTRTNLGENLLLCVTITSRMYSHPPIQTFKNVKCADWSKL